MRIGNGNPFRIRIFLLLSYSFGIETLNTQFPRKPYPARFQTKMDKVYTSKNPTLKGGTNLYGLYKGERERAKKDEEKTLKYNVTMVRGLSVQPNN